MATYYLTGTRTGLSVDEARQLVIQRKPAVARPQDRADWFVAFLSTEPQQPQQTPFKLLPHELP